ncbi:hypothetical protein SO3561_03497 [Streptomyces olivochromogenes]|uniref:Uncharacterized protein n=1 Tax=Streptomyces olivochromogenes TaxID=1963 RepID=A0A250VDB2_STROL|nr:hypothetical protein SO3561_03497 [Streptomyces olivochromogenes]
MDMIHVRAVCPPDLTRRAMALLDDEPCAVNVCLQTGSVRNPDGDAIECDVLTGAANDVLRGLRDLGPERHGSIVLDPVDTVFSEHAERTGDRHAQVPAGDLATGGRTPAPARGHADGVGADGAGEDGFEVSAAEGAPVSRNSRIAKATSTITTVHTTTHVVG